MKLWWKRNDQVELGDYTQGRVEDFTGCIPLFLNKCVVKGENGKKDKISLETDFFTDVFEEVTRFEKNLQDQCGHGDLLSYVAVVLPI